MELPNKNNLKNDARGKGKIYKRKHFILLNLFG